MLFIAALLFSILLFGALTVILRIRSTPMIGALPIAFCLIIAFESIILNFLSFFHWVNFHGVLWSHIAIISCWLTWFVTVSNHPKRPLKRLISAYGSVEMKRIMIVLFPIIILLFFMLAHYPPNTYDSMTYHMARVVHWMQNQSIEYFYTSNERQNELGPGAEYLILFFQIITNSDYLANTIQFFSYILLPGAILYLLRVLKISQHFRIYIVFLTVSAPMILFQAGTTQTDLVAALVAVATIITSIRLFAGNMRRVRLADFFLLGTCLAVGFLVKPTSVLVALPIVCLGCVLQAVEILKNKKTVLYGISNRFFRPR